MAQSSKAVGIDNTFRRKFDKEEYLERTRIREAEKDAEKKSKSKAKGQRKPLKKRDFFEVDLESRLGKTRFVTPIAPLSQQAGYICSDCECVVKDSENYLDHINGKKNQRALGMSMGVEQASVQQVQQRFQLLKKKRKDTGSFTEQDFDDRIWKQRQEEEERKHQRRERKKEKKEDVIDPDIAALMGFGGFGSSKR